MTQAAAQEVTGLAELRLQQQFGVTGVPWQLTERFRPEFSAPLGERLSLTTTVDLSFAQGRRLQDEVQGVFEASDLFTIGYLPGSIDSLWNIGSCSWPDPASNEALGISQAGDYLAVDRLYADAYLKGADVRIGRQAVQWGSAQLVNPTDPFPEVLFVEPWRFRRGLNAGRATVPIEGGHQVQVLAGTDDTFRHERLATRGTANIKGTELSLVGAWRGDTDEPLVGLDLRGNVEIGWWFEGALHATEDPYEEFAVGVDYSFPVFERFVVLAQYYRNGSGSPDAGSTASTGRFAGEVEPPHCEEDGFSDLVPDSGANPFAPITAGRDYAIAAVNLAATNELSFQLSAIHNLGDGTGVMVPTTTWAVLEWLELSATGQVPYKTSEGGEFKPDPADMVLTIDPTDGEAPPVDLDFSGLAADAAVVVWARASF